MNELNMAVPTTVRLGDMAPDFEARTTSGILRLSSLRGKWVVLFSHPADFTPVCTTEFVTLAKAQDQFDSLNCALLGLSVDSLYSHKAWIKAIKDLFDVEVKFPIIEDPSLVIGRAYGMISQTAADSSSIRATYFIDPDGVVRLITYYPMNVGRSVPEMIRVLQALQAVQGNDRLTPEGWQPGQPLLVSAVGEMDRDDWFCRSEA